MRNLFVLVDDETPARRLPMDQDVQKHVAAALQRQAAKFLSDDVELIEFDGRYTPDENEVLIIRNFAIDPKVKAALAAPLTCETLDLRVDPDESLPKIKGVVSSPLKGEGDLFVQVFDRRQVLSQHGLTLFHHGATYRRLAEPGLVLNSSIDAVVSGTDLYFRSYFLARRLFNLVAYFQEATDEDVDEFADAHVFHVEDKAALLRNADSWVRRKIRFIKEAGILTQVTAKQIEARANEFGIGVKTIEKSGKMRVVLPSSKADFKMVLRVLDDDCFTGIMSGTRFVSNSKRKV